MFPGCTIGFWDSNKSITYQSFTKALNDKLKVTVDLSATNRDAKLGFMDAFRYATIFNPTARCTMLPIKQMVDILNRVDLIIIILLQLSIKTNPMPKHPIF